MKRLKKFLILGLALVLLVGCKENKEEGPKTESEGQVGPSIKIEETAGLKKFSNYFFDSFDTITQTTVFAETEEEGIKYSNYIKDRMAELHKEFSSFEGYEGINNVYTINEMAGKEPVKVSPVLFDLLKTTIDDYMTYSKKNDISFGRVTEIWRDYMDAHNQNPETDKGLPSMEDLEEANAYTGLDHIRLDEENQTVFIDNENTKLDVGAVAKGYAVELVAKELAEMGAKSVLISAGGNVRTLGGPLDGKRENWAVGVQNPDKLDTSSPDSVKETLYLKDLSVVTSGDYERYFTYEGKNYHHIIDVDTLYPADHFRSITLVTKDSGLADFLSTAVFCMDVDEGMNLINSIDGVEALWILNNGDTVHTKGMETYMKSMGAGPGK